MKDLIQDCMPCVVSSVLTFAASHVAILRGIPKLLPPHDFPAMLYVLRSSVLACFFFFREMVEEPAPAISSSKSPISSFLPLVPPQLGDFRVSLELRELQERERTEGEG